MTIYLTIFLGLIISFLLYLIYQYYFGKTATLTSSLSLLQSNPAITSIANPTSSKFGFGIWIYVNSWTQGNKTIFSCSSPSSVSNPDFSLSLDSVSPILYVNINTTGTPAKIIATNNFPIQTWTYVIISVDSNVCDCYINGQLVTSQQLLGQMTLTQANNNNWSINFGSVLDIMIANFTRVTNAIDPATAVSMYGTKPATASTMSSYGLQVAVTKNNIAQTPITVI